MILHAAVRPLPTFFLSLLFLVRAPDADLRAQAPGYGPAVDSVFVDVDRTSRPGCAVSVTRDGALELARGYGMANLEYGIPIRPSSVFHVASVSKHFTAFAVELLAQEGRVSWDDDIRAYVPELRDTGHRVTLDHLVHHTSGVRDQWELLIMAGWRWEADLVRQRDALELIVRQPALNFPPGTDWSYSNSGYTLLAAVVERVSGRSLAAFARERIFEPLGMERTHFHDDHQHVVPGRAYAFEPSDADGWKISIPDFAVVGATSLFTTVEDLARWERNLRTGEVGGRRAVENLLHRTEVAGEAHDYAHGLGVGEHRGLRTVAHGGADAGYRAHFLRYPDQGVGVSVLCNEPSAGPAGRARRVAEAALAGAFPEPAEADAEGPEGGEAGEGEPEVRLPQGLSGWYASPAIDLPLHVAEDGEGGLTLAVSTRSARPLAATADSVLEVAGGSTRLLVPTSGAPPAAVRLDDGSGAPRRYARVSPADTARAALDAYVGWYWSDDVGTLYRARVAEDGGLELWQRRHGAIPATPTHRDAFAFRDGFMGVTFTRDDDGEVDGMTMSGPRTWKVRFRKVEGPRPPGTG